MLQALWPSQNGQPFVPSKILLVGDLNEQRKAILCADAA
jgi:hypothetical protein